MSGRVLSNDLRWRNRPRYDELRQRALAYYRERMRGAPPEELAWLLGERLYLWDDTFNQTLLFNADDVGRVWVEMARPEDTPDLVRIWERWIGEVMPSEGRIPLITRIWGRTATSWSNCWPAQAFTPRWRAPWTARHWRSAACYRSVSSRYRRCRPGV